MQETIEKIIGFMYAYCTDFCINLANIMHISYYEICFYLFIILFPLLVTGLPITYWIIKVCRKHKSSK
jgi:hypothetical protein